MNEKDFVTFEQAKKLKELKFDWKTYYAYTKEKYTVYDRDIEPIEKGELISKNSRFYINPYCIDAPFIHQVQNWLREEKKFHIVIRPYFPKWVEGNYSITKYCLWYNYMDEIGNLVDDDDDIYDSYYEALNAGINKALELL